MQVRKSDTDAKVVRRMVEQAVRQLPKSRSMARLSAYTVSSGGSASSVEPPATGQTFMLVDGWRAGISSELARRKITPMNAQAYPSADGQAAVVDCCSIYDPFAAGGGLGL